MLRYAEKGRHFLSSLVCSIGYQKNCTNCRLRRTNAKSTCLHFPAFQPPFNIRLNLLSRLTSIPTFVFKAFKTYQILLACFESDLISVTVRNPVIIISIWSDDTVCPVQFEKGRLRNTINRIPVKNELITYIKIFRVDLLYIAKRAILQSDWVLLWCPFLDRWPGYLDRWPLGRWPLGRWPGRYLFLFC